MLPKAKRDRTTDGRAAEAALADLLRQPQPPSDVLIGTVSAAAEADQVSAEFVRRAEEASLVGLTMRRAAGARAQVGFQPMPLEGYLEALARRASTDLALVWRFVGIEAPNSIASVPARYLARIGWALGISAREMVAHVRLSLLGPTLVPEAQLVVVRRGESGSAGALEMCEAVLDDAAAEADAKAARRYAAIRSDLLRAYAQVREEHEP